jgi:hypothetical protein
MAGGKEKRKKNKNVDSLDKTGKAEPGLLVAEEKRIELDAPEEEKMLSVIKPQGELREGLPKKEKRSSKKEMEKELREIYKEEDGEMPDMSKIYRRKRSRAKMILGGLVIFFAFLAALSWAGFFFFGKGRSFTGEKVGLEISAPASLAGGETMGYVIKYTNGEDVPLGQAEVEVRLPDDFVLGEVSPSASEGNNLWQLGSLAAGETGEIKISGSLRGALDSLQAIQAVLTYKPGDFNSEFQKIATAVTKIDNSALGLELTGPERVLSKSEATFKIKYKNNSAAAIRDVKISILAPADFSFKEKSGEKEISSWDIAEVGAGEEKEIEFSGSFGPTAEGEREFKAQIGFVKGDNFYLQKESNFKTNALVGAMVATLIANGDSKDRTVNFGDTLNYSIAYQNKDKAELGDVEIKMVFESTSRNNKMLLDWTSLKDDSDGLVLGTQLSPEIRQGVITWNKKQISSLGKLAPSAEGTINFQIKLKSFTEFKDWGVKDFAIKSLVTVKIGKMGGEVKEETIESNVINLKVNSDLSFETAARYFNDDNIAVGTGPLPPKVGETTAYRIFWKISNSLHELENLKVSTILPENIKWSNKFEIKAGDLKFDEATREIAWTLNRIPLDIKELEVNFEITVTPAEAEKGKLLTLILDTSLAVGDKSTGGTISKSGGVLTTNLDGDQMAEGKGIVK